MTLGCPNIHPDKIVPVNIYNQSYYSLVAESASSNRFSFFTEKTAKPILAKRPFIYFSGQGYLRNLRKLGFRTFGPVIDESYDDIDDPVERWEKAWAQVIKLCQMPPPTVIAELGEILRHNHDHFIKTDWWAPIRRCFQGVPTRLQML
jgi:hypothetical protein